MFKSIELLKYLGHSSKTDLRSYNFKITDDNFIIETIGTSLYADNVYCAPSAVINCYENKNLSVSKNIFLCFSYLKEKYGNKNNYFDIPFQIEHCRKYQSSFLKYKEDVEKYLSLI
jgi:hypothetical protein